MVPYVTSPTSVVSGMVLSTCCSASRTPCRSSSETHVSNTKSTTGDCAGAGSVYSTVL